MHWRFRGGRRCYKRKKKRRGKKKREKNATYEQIFAPASNNGTTEHPSPYTSIFPRASIPLLSKHLQFPYYFPRRVSCFVTCRQTEILPPLSPPINRQFDHRHRIGKRLPNAWRHTHTRIRDRRASKVASSSFFDLSKRITPAISRGCIDEG